MLVVASSLLALWGYTCLEIVLRLAVLKLLSVVKLARLELKVLLHHVKVILIVLLTNARIAPDEDAEIVE